MAGIGFGLRHLLKQNSYLALLRAYGYAALIGSGPWVMSIVAIMVLGLIVSAGQQSAAFVSDFLVSVTWLVASSLIVTGPLQMIFTRFIADQLYIDRPDRILPNLLGLITLTTGLALMISLAVAYLWASDAPLVYKTLMAMAFVILCNLWNVAVFVAGVKNYHHVILAFAVGYGATLALGLWWQGIGINGLLSAFVVGQMLLLSLLMIMVIRTYPAKASWALSFFSRDRTRLQLLGIGLFYNLGIWADKLMFWFNPATSVSVIPPLRAAPLYDLPLFLAYLSIIPGMAVFLMRIETDFAENCSEFDRAIRNGHKLESIDSWRKAMRISVRRGIYDILKIQGLTVVVLLLTGAEVLAFMGFSSWYLPMFSVLVVAVGIQVLFMAVLNVLFYLDRMGPALRLCMIFCTANVALTFCSQVMGPEYYGYGYALSLLLVTVLGVLQLGREFRDLTFNTFMRQ